MTPKERAHAVVERYILTHPNAIEHDIATAIEEAVAAERERCAGLIPTTWLSPLLTGDRAVIGQPPYDCPDIAKLLLKIAAVIREAT